MSVKNLQHMKVAVLYGGESSERAVSLKSGEAILAAFKRQGVEVVAIDCTLKNLAQRLQSHEIEHCFIALHGGAGEDGTVQAVLQSLGISYTGSGMLGCAIAMDKHKTKLLWQGAGIKTAAFMKVNRQTSWQEVSQRLGTMFMIKPAHEGSSIGMSKVENAEQFEKAMSLALQYDGEIIAEKWLAGSEYTIAILGDKALPIIKLCTDHRFYDFEAKYESDDTQYLCPCGLDEHTEARIQQEALTAFKALGCSGWGRIDVMQDDKGEFYFLEANTVPGMTDHSLVPMAAKATGIGFDDLVTTILQQSTAKVQHVSE